MTWQPVLDFPGLSVRLEPNTTGRMVVTGVTLEAEPVTSEMLRRIPMARIENAANAAGSLDASLPPLRREPDMSPDEFSRLVAAHYRAWATIHANPATALATKWGVKPPTMHTWIREARLRGLLPPARRGKA